LCLLDYLERLSGIYPAPASLSGEETGLWFTSLIPKGIDFGQTIAEETGYSRTIDGALFEFINGKEFSSVYKNGEALYRFPSGLRLITNRKGELKEIIGMTVREVRGEIFYKDKKVPFTAAGNERLVFNGLSLLSAANPGVIPPNYGG
jgi:hypothetical protein